MLSFVDHDASIKVFRVVHDEDGRTTRERIGTVRKRGWVLDDALTSLDGDDRVSLNELANFYEKADHLSHQTDLYLMPSRLRTATEHVVTHGSSFEKEILMMALVESLRLLRRAERNLHPAS